MPILKVVKSLNKKINIKMKQKELIEKINKAINKIRPYLKADGGDVSLIDVTEDNVVHVRFSGACSGCPYSYMTLKAGIEGTIKREVPEIKEVVAIDAP